MVRQDRSNHVAPRCEKLASLCIAILTVVLGTSFSENLINRRFDISYGIYIYAFPIQQMTINWLTSNLWLGMAIAVTLTIGMACLSYHFVERPFLRGKHKAADDAVRLPDVPAKRKPVRR